MKKIFNIALGALALAACTVAAGSAQAADYANLKATVVLKGKAPAPTPIATTGAYCGTLKMVSESLIVNDKNNGIANVLLYPDPKSFDPKKADPSVKEPIVAKPVLDNNQCRFVPHLLVLEAGQELVVKNSDPEGHNANFAFLKNEPSNKQIPAKGSIKMNVPEAEPAPIPVSCGSHSWMKAHVVVLDHPFVGVSDENGQLEIKGLPAGKITLKLWQEAGRFKSVKINGKSVPVKRGAIEIELKPGMNDLGKIELDAEDFKA